MGTTTKEIGSSSFNDMISSVDRRSEYVENRAGANVRLNNFLTPYTLDDKSSILNAPCGYSNGVYASLRPSDAFGPELVTNGNFATDSDWTKANATISNGVATVTVTSGGFSAINQNITYVSGKKYRVTAQIQGSSGSNGKQIKFQDRGNNTGGLTSGNGTITLNETLQNIEIIWTANSNSTEIVVSRQTNSGNYSWTIDNISVKEDISADFSFTRGSAATRVTKDGLVKNVQILSDDLVQNGDFSQIGSEEVTNGDFSQIGSELVTNGDFATDSDWVKGTGWSISGGTVNCDGTQLSDTFLYQNIGNQSGNIIKFSFSVSNYVSGTLKTAVFGAAGTTVYSITDNGDYTFYINVQSGHNGNTGFKGEVGFIGSIDNVSVKEVGQDWTFFGEAELTSEGARIYSSTGNQSYIVQTTLALQSMYKLSYKITDSTQGSLKLINVNGLSDFPIPSTLGSHTVYFKADNLQLFIYRNSGVTDVTVTNISVKEVGQNWNFVGGANMTDNGVSFIDDGTNIFSYVQQLGILTSGRKYRVSFDVIRYVSGLAQVELGSINTPVDISSGVGTYTIESECNNTFGLIKRDGSSPNFDFDVSNISIIEVTDDTDLPRIDYTNGTGSLLLEPQSTNLITYSEDFSQSVWQKADVSITTGFLAPDGSNNAYKIERTGSSNTGIITGFSGQNTNKRKSIWAKTVSGTGKITLLNNNADTNALFDITEQWQRFDITHSSADFFYAVDFRSASATLNEVLIWGAQLEDLSYATSYIVSNSGSTTTRNADLCNNAGSSDLINSTEGVLYAEISALVDDTNYKAISVSDGSHSNRVQFSLRLNTIATFVSVGGSSQYSHTETVTNILDYHKIALVYKQNDYKLFVNGTLVDSSASGNTFPQNTLTELSFTDGVSSYFYGNAKCVAVFKEALTDEELAKITSTTQQEAFYEMRDKMLQINADYYEFGDYTTRLKKLF